MPLETGPHAIHVGIGGWTFADWRGTFYPEGLPHDQELAYAASRLTSIEINGTFYRTQSPESFAKWRDATPPGFVFSVKAPRVTTHRRDLAASEDSIARFLASGLTELGPKLGPILWQFPSTRSFDPAAMAAFLALLPPAFSGLTLRHVIEARHPSFHDPAYIALLSKHGVASAIIDSDKQDLTSDHTAPFLYARLQRNSLGEPEGYHAAALDLWAARAKGWAGGDPVNSPPPIDCHANMTTMSYDVYVYFISGDKVRAPDAAQAFLRRLGTDIDAVLDRDLR